MKQSQFDSFQSFKVRLRVAFTFFIFLVVSRTFYFSFLKGISLSKENEAEYTFNEIVFIYVSENLLSFMIILFVLSQQSYKSPARCETKSGNIVESCMGDDSTVLDEESS